MNNLLKDHSLPQSLPWDYGRVARHAFTKSNGGTARNYAD
jgi:hypothetical protein